MKKIYLIVLAMLASCGTNVDNATPPPIVFNTILSFEYPVFDHVLPKSAGLIDTCHECRIYSFYGSLFLLPNGGSTPPLLEECTLIQNQ